jgi:hypothetical protein
MQNKIRMIAVIAVLLIASETYAQAPTAAPFSLKLDVSPSNAKAGSNFVVEADLKNDTNKRIGIPICLGMKVECNFEVYVRDSHGNSPPETRYMKAVRHEDTGVPQLVFAWSGAGISIEPGEAIKFVSNLPELFELSHPDRYEIQVETVDPYTRKVVQSNVSHVIVSAQ